MAHRAPLTRSALRLVVALPLVLLTGCTGGQVCTEKGHIPSVAVDVRGLDVNPRSITGLVCVEDDCGALGFWIEERPAAENVRRLAREIPRKDEVEVRLVLADLATGAELYRGSGSVPTDVIEINGPGCGENRVLPTVVAGTDGTLRD